MTGKPSLNMRMLHPLHQPMPGIIVVSDTMPVGQAIEVLTMYFDCGTADEFENMVLFLPE